MVITIEANNRKIEAEKGETILSALQRNGIRIPTLCRMQDFSPTGACRLCVVEVDGRENLVTACSEPVQEWMKIKTHSPRVIRARRTILELLLASHPDDCLYCNRNLNCELQRLADELNIRERRVRGQRVKPRLDQSSPAVAREFSKCILCGRCVRVCEEQVTATSLDFINRGASIHIGTSMDQDLNFSSCLTCGQCIQVCPTGALHEKQYITEVQEYLSKKELFKAFQYSPSVPYALAEEMGMKYQKGFDLQLNGVLRKMGFDAVYCSGFGSDIMIGETARELAERIRKKKNLPLISSHCPAWVKHAEQSYTSMLKHLSGVKSAEQINGVLVKTRQAEAEKKTPREIYLVSAGVCTARKYEAGRDGMMRKGIPDIDCVLNIRELARLIQLYGVDIEQEEGGRAGEPMSYHSSSSVLPEVSGGLTEAVLRTLQYELNGKDMDEPRIKKLRGTSAVREYQARLGKHIVRVAVVDGLKELDNVLLEVSRGDKNYHFIEVMACPGGCINGGGQPFTAEEKVLKMRRRNLYNTDDKQPMKMAHRNPDVKVLYEAFLCGEGVSARSLFYTGYSPKTVLM